MTPARIAIATLLLLLPSSAQAESSAELWSAAGVKYKLAKKLKLDFTQHLRFEDDISQVQSFMPTLALAYRLRPKLKVAMGYRFAYKRTGSGDFERRHRLHTDAIGAYKFGDGTASYRLRLQATAKPDETAFAVRNRLRLKYRISDVMSALSSVETFHDADAAVRTLRITAGVEREIANQDVRLFYRYESPSDASEATLHILGVGFEHSL